MATLPVARFKELAFGIYLEIEKRFPDIAQDYNNRFGPLPDGDSAPSSQPSMPRVTSYSSQDNDRRVDRTERAERSERTERNDRTVERTVSSRDPSRETRERRDRSRESARSREGSRYRKTSPEPNNSKYGRNRSMDRDTSSRSNEGLDSKEEISNLRSNYEFKIAMLEKQVKDLESNDVEFKQMQDQIEGLTGQNNDLKNQLTQLQEENKFLQEDYNEQQRATEGLKNESSRLLEDVKKLTMTNQELKAKMADMQDENDRLNNITEKQLSEINRLKAEVEQLKEASKNPKPLDTSPPWKSKDDVSPRSPQSIPRSPVDSPKVMKKTWASASRSENSPADSGKGDLGQDPDSKLKAYEIAASDLSSAARKENGTAVLPPMKSILLTCKGITEEGEKLEDLPSVSMDDKNSLRDTKDKLSDALTHLMGAAKQHASSGGSPASASTIEEELRLLSFAVSDLVEMIKIVKSKGQSDAYSEPPTTADTMKDVNPNLEVPDNDNLPPMDMQDLRVIYFDLVLLGRSDG